MKKRVCFISRYVYGYFSPEHGLTGGGAERQINLLTNELKKEFDVHVIVGDYGQPKTEVREGVTLHRSYPSQTRQNFLQPVKHMAVLTGAMRGADADVYIHRGGPRNMGFIYLVTRMLNSRFVYNIANDANIHERPRELPKPIYSLFKHSLKNTEGVIAQTEYQRNELKNIYDVDSRVIGNGYPGVDSIVPHKKRSYFLWVGTLDEEQKRPHIFLDLAEEIPEQGFRVVGPVDTDKPYHRQIKRRGKELTNVSVIGEVSPSEIHKHYRNAAAVVNTSSFEGFPNTFLEAWRQATPVVSLDIDTGRYLPTSIGYAEGDLDELRRQVTKLGENIDYRRELGEKMLDTFESRYSLKNIAREYSSYLSSVLNTD